MDEQKLASEVPGLDCLDQIPHVARDEDVAQFVREASVEQIVEAVELESDGVPAREAIERARQTIVNITPPNFSSDIGEKIAAAMAAVERRLMDSATLSPEDLRSCDRVSRYDGRVEVVELGRRHNATCLRCNGPAYVSLGLPTCERVGGCLADVEPTESDVFAVDMVSDDSTCDADCVHVPEPAWSHALADLVDYAKGPAWATRELAVAAWRRAVLDRAFGR